MKQHLQPAPGLRVRKPDGSILPAEGESVALNTFWRRRINHGDVVLGPAPKPAAAGSVGSAGKSRGATSKQED